MIVQVKNHIVLVGMMGVGKTAIGRHLAAKLGLDFIDTDQYIVQQTGWSIACLFEMYGEDEFRKGEAKVITNLLQGPQAVISTGGGAIITEEVRTMIKKYATSIWIRADLDTLVARTHIKEHRPLLQVDDPRGVLKRLSVERDAYYQKSDIIFDNRSGSVDDNAEAIKAILVDHQIVKEISL